ncbi:MAG: hypothetical protein EXS13_13545 [Planctomycetes bacterium]|nr:hypothetical protein [Planctomycetota bacterium]
MGREAVVRTVVRTLLVALMCAAVGWIVGRRGAPAVDGSPRSEPLARDVVAAIRAECAELVPPRSEADGFTAWVTFEAQLAVAFARRGLAFAWGDEAEPERLRRCAGVAQPTALASLFDLWSEAAHHSDRRGPRDALLRMARALDPEPQRDAIRAALLANGAAEVRMLAADFGAEELPPATGMLLGLALWRCGERIDAIDAWECAAIESPGDPMLHLLLAWRMPALDADHAAAVRRHLAAANALLPASVRLPALLAATND